MYETLLIWIKENSSIDQNMKEVFFSSNSNLVNLVSDIAIANLPSFQHPYSALYTCVNDKEKCKLRLTNILNY